jgi:cell division transport system permease protein
MQTSKSKSRSKRLRTSYFSAVLSITMVLFMTGLLGTLLLDARKLSDYVREHVQLTIYLKDGAQAAEVEAFGQLIGAAPFTKRIHYVSKEAALDSLKRELGEDALGMLDSNPLPASLDISVNAAYSSPDSLEKIKQSLALNAALVDDVAYQKTQVDVLNRNFKTIALGLLVIAVVLLLVAATLINNTIRLSLYSSRFLIKSMQLVGATKNFIRGPFLKRGLWHGFIGGIIAMAMLIVVLYFIDQHFPELGQLSDLTMITALFAGMLFMGLCLSLVSTFLAVNKYLRLASGDLY